MAHPYHHALSSVKKWGGRVEDYLEVHSWFDASKEILADFRHRALRHHAEGIFMAETIFGPTLTLSSGRVIPTRWVGEQHVREDLGHIPSFADWARAIRPEPGWGARSASRRLSIRIWRPLRRKRAEMDGFYPLLRLPLSARSREVVRAAAKAIHPSLRRLPGLRLARRRFYRDMLNAHDAARARARQTGR